MSVLNLGPDQLIGSLPNGADGIFQVDMNEDITGKTVEIRFAAISDLETNVLTLTDGSGLTVTPATGIIDVNFTNTLPVGDYEWSLIVGNEDIWQGAFRSSRRTPGP